MIRQDWSSLKKLLFFQMAAGGGAAVEATATGNPLVFTTDLAKPLKSLLIPFSPQQEGSGDPSPENIRPILPWGGLSVFGGGKNLFDKDTAVVYNCIISSKKIYDTGNGRTFFVPCMPNTTYTVSKVATARAVLAYAKTEQIPVNDDPVFGQIDYRNETSATITTGDDATWLVLYVNNTGYDETSIETIKNSLQLEVGSSASSYEEYKPITETDIVFASPIYGGTLDVVSGVLTVTMVARTYDGTEDNWSNQSSDVTTRAIVWDAVRGAKIGDNRVIACNCLKPSNANQDEAPLNGILNTTQTRNIRIRVSQDAISYETFRAFLRDNPVTVVCPLVTPQEIQLTPAQITALVGDNTIWSDSNGSMTATYLKKG